MEDSIEHKEAYEAPSLTVHGTVEAITEAAGTGESLDFAFPRNTPFSQLTFS